MREFTGCLAGAMEDFISFKETHGHLRASYESILSEFALFCAGHYVEEASLTDKLVLEWVKIRPGESVNSLKRRARIIRQFGKYLNSTGIPSYVIPDDFIGGSSSFMPYIFSDAELTSLFKAVDATRPSASNPFKPLVLAVMFRLVYTCGLRPNEGRDLKRSNMNLVTGEILITGTKAHKERIVVMSDDMLNLCRRYDERRSDISKGNGYYFTDCNGEPYRSAWILKAFKSCWVKANPHISPKELPNVRVYDLRHRFATATLHRWLDEGRDLYAMLPYLRTYMGHANFEETAYYIHLLPENLVKSAGVDWSAFSRLMPEVDVWPE